jgi:tetratricopeptide (TPR) repeat protein
MRQLGGDHPATLRVTNNLAYAYRLVGRAAEAVPLHQETLKLQTAKLGPEHHETLASIYNLAWAYLAQGQLDQAAALFDESVRDAKRRWADDPGRTIRHLLRCAEVYSENRQFGRAEPLLREALELQVKTQPEHWLRFRAAQLLGASLLGQGKYADAEPVLLQAYQGLAQRATTIPAQWQNSLTEALGSLVQLYDAWGKKDQADKWRKKLEEHRK